MDHLTLRLDDPRELLAYVPHRLGFRPHESAVAVALRGPRGRVGLVVRVDLDDLAHPTHGPQVARALAGHLDRDGATRVLLVAYTERDAGERLAREGAAHLAEACDVPVGPLEALLVSAGAYRCLACPPGCCPPGGRPLDDLRSTRVGAEMVLAGSVVVDRREDLARIPSAPAEARRSVARARGRWDAARLRAAADGDDAVAAWRLASLRAWREEVGDAVARPAPAVGVRGTATDARGPGGRTTFSRLGRVEAGLRDRRVRDAVLVTLVPGTGRLPERSLAAPQVRAADDRLLGDAMARVVDPDVGVAPPPSARRHEVVLEQVVAHGRAGGQPPALTLLGLLAWWRGDGARASLLLDRALAGDGEYRLALLLARTLEAGLPPGWVRREG
ncbi:DUF4192 family protein [Cellulomonas sp. JZ18]|uniref:DUF4192 domain-containing protein n=1 Tax=Cellulomonas sp. JZ18 TaxID=2654191 RepID=UPI0012D47BA1|nr:DUF4192 domain-containing protein [Cellulomonas sp. JZ18]QGQ19137.1 DUF4192 family protein [Cellulomonas sp. JZ18]